METLTKAERELAKAIVRMYPIPPKTREGVIRKYVVARNIILRCAVTYKTYYTVSSFNEYIYILDSPSQNFSDYIVGLWEDTRL